MWIIILAIIAMWSTPCAHEYSTNCYWDAQVQGNHQGVSFLSIGNVHILSNGTVEVQD